MDFLYFHILIADIHNFIVGQYIVEDAIVMVT